MVGNVEFIVVNRHSFVRAALHERLRKPRETKMIRFPPFPRDQLEPLATKPAHLLRLTRYPRPYPRFPENRRRSTCGFVFTFFAVVGDWRPKVVNGPISWQAGHFRAGRVALRPAHAFTRGAGGAFLPHRPLFQFYSSAIPVWFLLWESCPLRLECGRCP